MADTPSDLPTPPSGPDFSNMPIEDALQLTMMLISDDAKKDTKDLLEVMDSIRRRVADGDTGTPAPGPTAPGWGGGVFGALPWLATILVAGIAGTALGLSGVLGVPVERVTVLESTASVISIAPTYACPGGPQIGQLRGGDHVVAVQRSDDSAYLGVRNPYDVAEVYWLSTSVVVMDAGQPAIATLPVGACPVIAIQYGDPEPVVTAEPQPAPPPNPQPGDTIKPGIGQQYATPSFLYQNEGTANSTNTTTVHAFASDNVGVTSVTISWAGPASGSTTMNRVGSSSEYTLVYTRPQGSPEGVLTFTMQARDAAGNLSTPVTTTVTFSNFG